MRILVTGGSGYIGGQFVKHLARDPGVEEVVILDINAPRFTHDKVRFVQRSVADNLTDLVTDADRPVDAIAHLAWILNPLRDRVRQREICIGGTRRVLEAAAVGRVRQVLYMSSGTAYGAHPDNRRPLTEFDELRDEYHFQYSREKREGEFLCRRFSRDHPNTNLQIVRPAVVGGPNVSNYLFRLIDKPVAFSIIGHEPELQLVHETDVARALCAIIRSDVPGAFNLGGEGGLTAPDCYRLMQRRAVPMPLTALRAVMSAGWRLNARAVTEAPADFLYFLAYPWNLSSDRIERELGFKFRYTSRQVFDAWRNRDRAPEPEPAAATT